MEDHIGDETRKKKTPTKLNPNYFHPSENPQRKQGQTDSNFNWYPTSQRSNKPSHQGVLWRCLCLKNPKLAHRAHRQTVAHAWTKTRSLLIFVVPGRLCFVQNANNIESVILNHDRHHNKKLVCSLNAFHGFFCAMVGYESRLHCWARKVACPLQLLHGMGAPFVTLVTSLLFSPFWGPTQIGCMETCKLTWYVSHSTLKITQSLRRFFHLIVSVHKHG